LKVTGKRDVSEADIGMLQVALLFAT